SCGRGEERLTGESRARCEGREDREHAEEGNHPELEDSSAGCASAPRPGSIRVILDRASRSAQPLSCRRRCWPSSRKNWSSSRSSTTSAACRPPWSTAARSDVLVELQHPREPSRRRLRRTALAAAPEVSLELLQRLSTLHLFSAFAAN